MPYWQNSMSCEDFLNFFPSTMLQFRISGIEVFATEPDGIAVSLIDTVHKRCSYDKILGQVCSRFAPHFTDFKMSAIDPN